MKIHAYFCNETKSWVRMEKQADGEWCHTSGYATREEAVAPSVENKGEAND